jgi:hypothetical protein
MLHFFSIRLRGWDLAALALIVSGPSMLICVLLHQGCFIRVLDVANRSAYQSQAAPGIVLLLLPQFPWFSGILWLHHPDFPWWSVQSDCCD